MEGETRRRLGAGAALGRCEWGGRRGTIEMIGDIVAPTLSPDGGEALEPANRFYAATRPVNQMVLVTADRTLRR